MKIVTSSWFTTLPPEYQKIGISRGTPRGYPAGYRKLPELMPGPWFKSVDPIEYDRRFQELLAALDPKAVLDKIETLAAGKDVALLCYEAPSDTSAWCHRGQVSAWLFDTLGLDVPEWGMVGSGSGHSHPKLFKGLRKGRPPMNLLREAASAVVNNWTGNGLAEAVRKLNMALDGEKENEASAEELLVARAGYECDDLTIDEGALTSRGVDGTWVQAWVLIPNTEPTVNPA